MDTGTLHRDVLTCGCGPMPYRVTRRVILRGGVFEVTRRPY